MALNGASVLTATGAGFCGSIPCTKKDLNLDVVLACGQSFRWKLSSADEWTGIIGGRVYTLQQRQTDLVYWVKSAPRGGGEADAVSEGRKREPEEVVGRGAKSHRSSDSESAATPAKRKRTTSSVSAAAQTIKADDVDHASALIDYFRLSVDLEKLYSEWAARDNNFAQKAIAFTGVRMLRQEPTENLFSFICSSNNNIARIAGMVDGLCKLFGEKLETYGGGCVFHAFPSVSRLAEDDVEPSLRTLGFGYRAKYISQTAKALVERHGSSGGSEAWLLGLRDRPYDDVIAELTQLSGVGRKVADCVALMSLDKLDAVPVDTHVFQIALRDYSIPDIKAAKSVTDKVYTRIGQHFRELYGPYAGWAHTILFSADLKKFKMLVK